MKNALNNQVGMLGNMFLWLVANLKQGVIYFIKQACGNEIMPSVYYTDFDHLQRKDYFLQMQPPRNIFVRVISKIKNFISRIHYMCVKTVESRDPTKADKVITVTIF